LIAWKRLSLDRFIEREEDPLYSALFRVMVAGFCLIAAFYLKDSILDVFGPHGFVDWEANRSSNFRYLPQIRHICKLLQPMGVTEEQTVLFLFYLNVTTLICLLIGLFTRIAAVLAFFLAYLFMYAGYETSYGVSIFMQIALFYQLFLPSNHALALDTRLWKTRRESVKSFGRKLLQFHMIMMYASSALEKAIGTQWWNGEAMWRSLSLPYHNRFDVSWLAYAPWLSVVGGILVLLTEIGYVFYMWIPRVRVLGLIVIVLLHLLIAILLGLYLFGLLMIVLNLGAFGPEAYNDIRKFRERRSRSAKPA
jgi:hypothetical protein